MEGLGTVSRAEGAGQRGGQTASISEPLHLLQIPA